MTALADSEVDIEFIKKGVTIIIADAEIGFQSDVQIFRSQLPNGKTLLKTDLIPCRV